MTLTLISLSYDCIFYQPDDRALFKDSMTIILTGPNGNMSEWNKCVGINQILELLSLAILWQFPGRNSIILSSANCSWLHVCMCVCVCVAFFALCILLCNLYKFVEKFIE